MSSSSYVALRDLQYSYPQAEQPVLRDCSVSFPQGFTGVVGANGVGKSTLLKLLFTRSIASNAPTRHPICWASFWQTGMVKRLNCVGGLA